MTTVVDPPDVATERYVTAREVADHIGTTPRWVVEKARDGKLPKHVLPGSNRVRFLLSEVRDAMKGD
jgi:predicted DNA-binding transcriptional regulator AlpA